MDLINYSTRLARRALNSIVLRDSGILALGNLLTTGLAFLSSVIMVRGLGADNYGVLVLGMTMITTTVQFMDVRGVEALVKFMTRELVEDHPRQVMAFVLVGVTTDVLLSIAGLLAVSVFVLPVASYFPQSDALYPILLMFSLTIPLRFMSTTCSGILTTLRSFRSQSVIKLVGETTKLVLVLVMVRQGLQSLVWAFVISTLVWFILMFVFALKELYKRLGTLAFEGYRQAWREYLPFTFATSLQASIQAVSQNLDKWLLGLFAPTSSIAFLNIASNAVALTALPIAPISQVIFPGLSEAWAKNDIRRVKITIQRFMLIGGVVGLVEVLVLGGLADTLVRLIYGPEFKPVVLLIYILLTGSFLELMFRWIKPAIIASGRPEVLVFQGLMVTIVKFVMLVVFSYQAQAVGAAIALVLNIVLTLVVVHLFPLRWVGLGTYFLPQETPGTQTPNETV